MTTETLLVKTKDNHVVAFAITFNNAAEKMRLTKECENACKGQDYADVANNFPRDANIKYDADDTLFINEEIFGYHWRKDAANFRNGLQDNNYPSAINQPNTIHFDNRIADDFYPEMIRQLGFQIVPHDEIFQVEYNPATNKYEAKDFKARLATVYKDQRKIEIVRNHFSFSAADYAKLQGYIRNFTQQQAANPQLGILTFADGLAEPDKSLFKIYATEYDRIKHRDKILHHELKHIINGIFSDGLGLKNDAKRLSVENMYRMAVEDERSAYMSQLIQGINEYLQKGDMQDFSMFDAECSPFAENLQKLGTDAEKIAYVTDYENLLKEMFKQFNQIHKANYDAKQFMNVTEDYVKNAPLEAPEDVDSAWFKKVRSLFYHYQIYNPTTKKMENVNLAKYIKPDMEVEISPEIEASIIALNKKALQDRMDERNRYKQDGKINPALIGPAKALMRGSTTDSLFVTEAENLQISTFYDDNYQPNQQIPSDNAGWSDNLQQYWQKFNGYCELSKNNEEYAFKIKNATILYTKANEVSMSNNAEYDLYVKMLKEPSNAGKPVEFLPTLSRKQALMLYVACINNGRKPTGAVPQDISAIENMPDIPSVELNKFKHRSNSNGAAPQNASSVKPNMAFLARQQRINIH